MSRFYDASTWQDIPHNSAACLYVDGIFAAPPDAVEDLGLTDHRWITITGDFARASIIDYERLEPDFTPASLIVFVHGRRVNGQDAIVYCNESTAAETVSALGGAGLLGYQKLFWWIATLDNVNRTSQEIASQLATVWHAPQITDDRIWANQAGQILGGTVDYSNLFLPWRP